MSDIYQLIVNPTQNNARTFLALSKKDRKFFPNEESYFLLIDKETLEKYTVHVESANRIPSLGGFFESHPEIKAGTTICIQAIKPMEEYYIWVKTDTKEIQKETHSSEIVENHFNFSLNLNTILYGPPGTGKTYHTINKAVEIADPEFYKINRKKRSKLKERFKQLLFDPETGKGQIAFVTFHQAMTYEDFVEGIKPLDPENSGGEIQYDIEPGIFKLICTAAESKEGNLIEKIEWLKKESSEADNKPPIVIKTGASAF